ncbi:hypothetical protein AVDCRST_MAG84-3194, partial [uncultured Microcoleus sp.]
WTHLQIAYKNQSGQENSNQYLYLKKFLPTKLVRLILKRLL